MLHVYRNAINNAKKVPLGKVSTKSLDKKNEKPIQAIFCKAPKYRKAPSRTLLLDIYGEKKNSEKKIRSKFSS